MASSHRAEASTAAAAMLAAMLRPAPVLALAVATLATLPVGPFAALGEAAPHGGKVVRVERRLGRSLGTPRYCLFNAPTVTVASCAGRAVEPGETITIITATQVIGRLHVTHVNPDTSCGAPSTWVADGDFEGDGVLAPNGEVVIGVVDGGLDPRRARALALDTSPSGRLTDMEYYGFDTDGDGVVDLAFDHFNCDAQGAPSQAMTAQCFEAYVAAPKQYELRRLRIDVVPQC